MGVAYQSQNDDAILYSAILYNVATRLSCTNEPITRTPTHCRVVRAVCQLALCAGVLLAGCSLSSAQPAPPLEASTATPSPEAGGQPETTPISGEPNETAPPAGDTPTTTPATPALSVADAAAAESDGVLPFTVTLSPPSAEAVVVSYATEDGTATAGDDYQPASGTLTFVAGVTSATVAVVLVEDLAKEGTETLTLRLDSPEGAAVRDGEATGEVTDSAALALISLQVTGGGTMWPTFDAGILHYAVTCGSSTSLNIAAQAWHSDTVLTLLRADSSANVVAAGALDSVLAVNGDNDIAIELGGAGETVTYIVHCVPEEFPEIGILASKPGVSDGLLLVTPRWLDDTHKGAFLAIIDNHGVPRYHRSMRGARNFRRHDDGRYTYQRFNGVYFLDQSLQDLTRETPQPPLDDSNAHDFLITEEGNYLFMDYVPASRRACEFETGGCGSGSTEMIDVRDSWIQELTPGGEVVFEWNSADHLKLSDCTLGITDNDYAHLNSLYLVEGDIIASFRHCNTVVRIDRSSGTGALLWQVGGTAPPRDPDTRYLAIVGDTDGHNEFCAQHSAVLSASGALLLFDNGVLCKGARKGSGSFSRVVEYRLVDTETTRQAVFSRQVRLPAAYGYAATRGAVAELSNGNWLIAWGSLKESKGIALRLTVSEVDPGPPPGTNAEFLLNINMHLPSVMLPVFTYRAYREREADIRIPLNLP